MGLGRARSLEALTIQENMNNYAKRKAKKLLNTKLSKRDRKELKAFLKKNKKKKRKYKKKTYQDRKKEYASYIHSKEWKELRLEILFRDGNRCRYCGSNEKLEVHHLHYRNFKREKHEDLITVCALCHKEIHSNKVYN